MFSGRKPIERSQSASTLRSDALAERDCPPMFMGAPVPGPGRERPVTMMSTDMSVIVLVLAPSPRT